MCNDITQLDVLVMLCKLTEYAKHEEEKDSRSELDAMPTLIEYTKREEEMDPKSVIISESRKHSMEGKLFMIFVKLFFQLQNLPT